MFVYQEACTVIEDLGNPDVLFHNVGRRHPRPESGNIGTLGMCRKRAFISFVKRGFGNINFYFNLPLLAANNRILHIKGKLYQDSLLIASARLIALVSACFLSFHSTFPCPTFLETTSLIGIPTKSTSANFSPAETSSRSSHKTSIPDFVSFS